MSLPPFPGPQREPTCDQRYEPPDWGAPPVLLPIGSALHQGLERTNTFLSASNTFLREPITKLASPPGALLAGSTQGRQGSDGKQTISYRVS